MDKPRIFIASSGRTLLLADRLREELQTEFCEARLWSEESRRQPGATIIEMLENTAEQFDFAVVILARDDVMVRETGDMLKARDNCVFEAGLFMKALGRERCFLVNSVEQRDLPSDLGGIISLPFKEPDDLSDRHACAQAITHVSAALKDNVQLMGRLVHYERVPLLSLDDVLLRERPQSDGGDLHEGRVIVCDVQPYAVAEAALQIRRNLNSGISYMYFLPFDADTIDKVLQGLQAIVAGSDASGEAPDFNARREIIMREKQRILDELDQICLTQSLLVSFFPFDPLFCFRVHNASDSKLARLYLRYPTNGFMLWAQGTNAISVWRTLPNFMPTDNQDQIFISMKSYDLKGETLQRFKNSLNRALKKYFPGIEDEVSKRCVGA